MPGAWLDDVKAKASKTTKPINRGKQLIADARYLRKLPVTCVLDDGWSACRDWHLSMLLTSIMTLPTLFNKISTFFFLTMCFSEFQYNTNTINIDIKQILGAQNFKIFVA